MRCLLPPTADVPSHTSGAAMGQQPKCTTGIRTLRPLTIADAADDIEDHTWVR